MATLKSSVFTDCDTLSKYVEKKQKKNPLKYGGREGPRRTEPGSTSENTQASLVSKNRKSQFIIVYKFPGAGIMKRRRAANLVVYNTGS